MSKAEGGVHFWAITAPKTKELNLLNSMLRSQKVETETCKSQQIKLEPRLILVPKIYLELNVKYMTRKCSLCDSFSPLMPTIVCLISDKVLCEKCCDPKTNEKGNLNKHAKQFHMGAAYYLDKYYLGRGIINFPLIVEYIEEHMI